MTTQKPARREQGFALIVAILALLLLTFLGLTLAVTTSTELQIATNYRWSQQALFNAEAGLEAARAVLRQANWTLILPPARVGADLGGCVDGGQGTVCWFDTPSPGIVGPPNAPFAGATRDFENGGCDARGAGMGYGAVLRDVNGGQHLENMASFGGNTLNGAFTVWVRRPLQSYQDGSFADFNDTDDILVLTAEGSAPFVGAAGGGRAGAARAVRVLEATFSRTVTTPCGTRGGQVGGGPEGSNFSPCDPITGDSLAAALGLAPGSVTEATSVQ